MGALGWPERLDLRAVSSKMGVNLRGSFRSAGASGKLESVEPSLRFPLLLLPYVVAIGSGLNFTCCLFVGSALFSLSFLASSTNCGAKRLGFGLVSFSDDCLTSLDNLTVCSTGSGAKRLGFDFCSLSDCCGVDLDDLVVVSIGSAAKRLGFGGSSKVDGGGREDLVVSSIGVGANFLGGIARSGWAAGPSVV